MYEFTTDMLFSFSFSLPPPPDSLEQGGVSKEERGRKCYTSKRSGVRRKREAGSVTLVKGLHHGYRRIGDEWFSPDSCF